MNKVQPESGSGKSNENRKAKEAWEIPDERKVSLLKLALKHLPTSANLEEKKVKEEAKKCTLIKVENGEWKTCTKAEYYETTTKKKIEKDAHDTETYREWRYMLGDMDKSTTWEPCKKAQERRSRFVRYNGLLVLGKKKDGEKVPVGDESVQLFEESVQLFEDKIPTKSYEKNAKDPTEFRLLFIPKDVGKEIFRNNEDKKVLLLELALMHRPTAASLTKPQLKMAAKECTLIEVYDYFLAKKYNESDELENDNDKKIFFDDLEERTVENGHYCVLKQDDGKEVYYKRVNNKWEIDANIKGEGDNTKERVTLRDMDKSTTWEPCKNAQQSGSRFVRYNGLLVLEKVQKYKFSREKVKDKSIQFFEDKFPTETFKKKNVRYSTKKPPEFCILFIPETVEKAIYGRYYTPRGVKNKEGNQKPTSICGRYDPVSKRLRYWWAENKCYRYFMIWLAIHLVMLIAYHVVSATMRNDMMESIKGYKKDAKGKGHLQHFHDDTNHVEIKVSKLK